jgi:hypothetical protein
MRRFKLIGLRVIQYLQWRDIFNGVSEAYLTLRVC